MCFRKYWTFSRVSFSSNGVVDDDERQKPDDDDDDDDCSTERFDIDWSDIDDEGSQTYKSGLLEPNSITGQFEMNNSEI